MNEYLRKDAPAESNETPIVDRPRGEKVIERLEVSDLRSTDAAPAVPAVESRPAQIASSGTVPAVAGASGIGPATARAAEEEKVALFAPNEANDLRARWDSIQVGFVDEPRKAVQEADVLVSDTIKRLSEVFGTERHTLEQQWDRNENVSTEDLRVALRRYRSFFGRLLAI
jgi:hypothetical protein